MSGTAKLLVALLASLIVSAAVDKYVDPNPAWGMPKVAAPKPAVPATGTSTASASVAATGTSTAAASATTTPKRERHQHPGGGRLLSRRLPEDAGHDVAGDSMPIS